MLAQKQYQHFYLHRKNKQTAQVTSLANWLTLPMLLILSTLTLLTLSTRGELSATAYWAFQLNEFLLLNHYFAGYSQSFWSNVTLFGDASVLLPLCSLVLFVRPSALLAVLTSVPMAALSTQLGKAFWSVPRPGAILDQAHFRVIGEVLSGHNSLPSGHTITIFTATIAMLVIFFPKIQTAYDWCLVYLVVGFAAVVGVSRIAVGAHWPMDVLNGCAFGWLAGISGALIVQKWACGWSLWSSRKQCFGAGLVLGLMSGHLIIRAWFTFSGSTILWISGSIGLVVTAVLFFHNSYVFKNGLALFSDRRVLYQLVPINNIAGKGFKI